MLILNCKHCNQPFESGRKDRKWCASQCRKAAERLRNPGKVNKTRMDWAKRNPEQDKALSKAWRESNPEKYAAQMLKKREQYSLEMYGKVITDPINMSKDRYRKARALGYRSGLEVSIANQLKTLDVDWEYEAHKIKFIQPAKNRTYTPDIALHHTDGKICFIELKGKFTSDDRMKHLMIKESQPELDIRFVFQNSRAKISKGSKTSYADWCNKNGFLYADKLIPTEWL